MTTMAELPHQSLRPDVAYRSLRLALRNARISAGMSHREVATALRWPLMRVLQAESRVIPLDSGYLMELIDFYDLAAAEKQRLMRLAERSAKFTLTDA